MRRIGYLALAMSMVALSVLAQEKVDQRRPAAKDGVVEVSNVAGVVKVTGWDREEVAVTGTLGKGTERLEFAGSGGRTRIKVVLPHFSHHVDGSDLEIQVPAGSQLEVQTVSADIEVRKVTGKVRLEAVSGAIAVAGEPNRFEARTVSGEIEISAANAPGRAKSVSGDITLKGVAGAVEAGSVSGALRVTGGEVTNVELETTSGRIVFDAALAKDSRLEAKSVSGEVEITLPANVAAEFDVTTFSGGISNDLGPAARRASEYGPGKELSFSTGGGARVVVKSFSGSVYLRKR
jgi:DUF4097 and DUF4098 domain-containing protein YvlB